MAWRFSDAPDQIGKEVRENLATGDYVASNPDWSYVGGVWSRDGGGTLVLADGDPFTAYTFKPDATYTLAAEVLADTEATIGWGMSLELNGEQIVIGDVGVDVGETVPGGEWVTASKEWRSPDGGAVGSVAFYASAPGVVRVRNVSVAEQTGRVILTVPGDVLAESIMASGGIIAGTPGGARVELTEDGLASYDATGAETATIRGEGGEFVGGEFRTSDNLPGQVTLSDTAASGGPGISVTPANATGYTEFPFVGPYGSGVRVSGGENAAGESSFVSANPTAATLQAGNGAGTWTQISTDSLVASLVRYGADGSAGRVGVYPGFAIIEYEYEGTLRRIGVNNSGFFLSTKTGEETTSRDLLSLFDRLDALEARVAALEN